MTNGELESDERLVLSELLNHVLDKGLVITGDVTISVADIDLVRVGLSLFLSSVETLEARDRPAERARWAGDDGLPVLPRHGGD
jgi:hypothetical protein